MPYLQNLPLAGAVTQVKNWSVYAQAAYDFTRALTLSVSGRYIHESNGTQFSDGERESLTQRKFLPSANLSYKLDGGGNVYGRWARGFKAGGVNPVALPSAFTNVASGSLFKGEQVDTYEAGVKVPLDDRRLQLTADVFYNDYTNLQVQAHSLNPAIIEAILNAGSARTYGVEGTANWRPVKPLTLGITAGYLNARYRNFVYGGENTDYVYTNLSGSQMTDAPRFQLSLSGALDRPITERLDLVANALVTRSSRILWAQSGAPGLIPDASDSGYWLANVRVGVKTPDDRYSFTIYANNLFNTAYTTFGTSSPATGTQDN